VRGKKTQRNLATIRSGSLVGDDPICLKTPKESCKAGRTGQQLDNDSKGRFKPISKGTAAGKIASCMGERAGEKWKGRGRRGRDPRAGRKKWWGQRTRGTRGKKKKETGMGLKRGKRKKKEPPTQEHTKSKSSHSGRKKRKGGWTGGPELGNWESPFEEFGKRTKKKILLIQKQNQRVKDTP